MQFGYDMVYYRGGSSELRGGCSTQVYTSSPSWENVTMNSVYCRTTYITSRFKLHESQPDEEFTGLCLTCTWHKIWLKVNLELKRHLTCWVEDFGPARLYKLYVTFREEIRLPLYRGVNLLSIKYGP